ncbi:MRP-L47-domain-containing protein [Cystobasidium minutum MCA 4210]|uniref:mitochondrial 54S ribosomal protein uL29m n=1 Tax=Cystobasidium minutum MCA 4210 TaxID=1397322 RepID=UPI0034CD6B1D|eukprot:jgi/Rhomi1/169807/fgenesh1_kg.3_\
MMLLRSSRPALSTTCSSLAASCSYTFSTSAVASGSSKKSPRKAEPPKGPKNTPPGTNAKPAASGRPKRYDTTYGIPPLHPAMYRTGANKLKREVEEKAQQPDFEKLWRLQDEIASTTNARELEQKTKELAELRANQPRRHPLWAFFHEKTKRDAEDLDKYAKWTKGPNGEDIPPPGYYALGNALNRPNREASRSGRSWDAAELRRKSFDDLHKLWYLLLMERNVLHTQKEEAKRQGVELMSYTYVSEQLLKCRKTMARIKYILNERRLAAREAQSLIRAAEAGNGSSALPSREQATLNFMEEEAPKSTSQVVS